MTAPAEHGTRACYLRGCRRPECHAAHVEYGANRRRQIAYGRWQPWADAEPVRIHVKELQAAGVSWARVARLAGVKSWVVRSLLYGYAPGCAPSRRVRRENAERILAVRVPQVRLNSRGLVDATGTRRRLRALMACGWTQAALAAELDRPAAFVSRLLGAPQVREATARRVRAMYDRLGRPAPATHQGRAAAERARRTAERNGWPPPAAWDDDTIDDPAASPAGVREPAYRLSSAEIAEEAADLFRQGLDRPLAAERLALRKSSLDTVLARERKRQTAKEATLGEH